MARSDACVLCSAPISYSVPELQGYRVCRHCDLTWSLADDPTDPTDEWEKDYYGRSDILQLHEARKSGMEAIVARLSTVCPHRGRLLDVGTGIGTLMQAAARDGWSVEGVEPSMRAAELARKLTGRTVYTGLLEEVKLPAGQYDVVTALDVVRQVPDPLRFLRHVRQLLHAGGVLLIREGYRAVLRRSRWLTGRVAKDRVPKRRRRAFEYAQCFSPKSLLYALQAIGLEGWVEPSPVFVEPASGGGLLASLPRRAVGLASAVLYQASGRRILISPNLLAFGRVSDGAGA